MSPVPDREPNTNKATMSQVPDKESNTEMVTMSQNPDKEPSSFLSLSREIRQIILYESFEDALNEDIGFNTNLAILHFLLTTYTHNRPVSAPSMGMWASRLAATHETASDDLGFVLSKRLDELEVECKTMEEGSRARLLRECIGIPQPEPGSEPRGLHHYSVVCSKKNVRRWGLLCFRIGDFGLPYLFAQAPLRPEDLEQNRRDGVLRAMIEFAVCSDDCHHY